MLACRRWRILITDILSSPNVIDPMVTALLVDVFRRDDWIDSDRFRRTGVGIGLRIRSRSATRRWWIRWCLRHCLGLCLGLGYLTYFRCHLGSHRILSCLDIFWYCSWFWSWLGIRPHYFRRCWWSWFCRSQNNRSARCTFG